MPGLRPLRQRREPAFRRVARLLGGFERSREEGLELTTHPVNEVSANRARPRACVSFPAMQALPLTEQQGPVVPISRDDEAVSRRLAGVSGVAVAMLAYALSGPALMLGIDYDNALHLPGLAQGCGAAGSLATCGYTAHLALVPFYAVFAAVLSVFGASPLEAVRVCHALCLGAGAFAAALLFQTLRASRVSAGLALAIWIVSPASLFLIRTLEDDCLSAAAIPVLFYLLLDTGRSSARRAALLGACLGSVFLLNYSFVVWAPVVVFGVAVTAGAPRARAGRLAALLAGCVVPVALWGAWVVASDPGESLDWVQLVLTGAPHSLAKRSGSLYGMLRYLAAHPLSAVASGWPAGALETSPLRWAPVIATLLLGAAFAARAVVRSAAGSSPAARMGGLAGLALVLCGLPAAWRNDWTYFERMVHVPFCVALLFVAAGARLTRSAARCRVARGLLAAGAVALVATNAWLSLAGSVRTSGLARFADLKARHPEASLFVFTGQEIPPGDFGLQQQLRLALPNHLVLTDGCPADRASEWPQFVLVHRALAREAKPGAAPGVWLSPKAQSLLATAGK